MTGIQIRGIMCLSDRSRVLPGSDSRLVAGSGIGNHFQTQGIIWPSTALSFVPAGGLEVFPGLLTF